MNKIHDDFTGFDVIITNDKLKIEMPIPNIIRGFNRSPNNWDQRKIRKGCRQEFIEWLATVLLDDVDQDTGDNFIATMLEGVFERLYEDDLDFLSIPDER